MLKFSFHSARRPAVAKLLLFLLVLFGIYLLRRVLQRPPGGASGAERPAGRAEAQAERMIECAHCGVHVPESEAVTGNGASFCCEAHRQAYRGGPGAGG